MASSPIANELRKLSGVDDYEYVTVPTYENGATPETPGFEMSVRCAPDHIDKKIVGYVRFSP